MTRHTRAMISAVLVTGGMFLLAGCDLDHKTYLSPNRVQVEKSRYDAEVPIGSVDEAFYQALAQQYRSSGGGGLYLSFVYNPSAGGTSALEASEMAGNAARTLRSYGISDVKTDILPVMDSAHSGKVLISYTRYAALAPKDCKPMPGIENNQIELSWDYKYGCSIEQQIAEQIARPRDLLGQGGLPETSSGRRAAIMSAPHEAGVPNEPLEGMSITGEN